MINEIAATITASVVTTKGSLGPVAPPMGSVETAAGSLGSVAMPMGSLGSPAMPQGPWRRPRGPCGFVELIFQVRDLLNVWYAKSKILQLKSAIIQGPLLKSGVPPPRSSGEVITSSYPVLVFIDKSALKTVQFQNRNGVHIKIGIS